MRRTRMLVWACLVAVLAGCSTSVGEGTASSVSQPAAPVAGAPPGAEPQLSLDLPPVEAGPGGTATAGEAQRDSAGPALAPGGPADQRLPRSTGSPVPVGQP